MVPVPQQISMRDKRKTIGQLQIVFIAAQLCWLVMVAESSMLAVYILVNSSGYKKPLQTLQSLG